MSKRSDEILADLPQGGQHAEDTVEAKFVSLKVAQTKDAVTIGSDPKACEDRCTPRYSAHAWAKHERPWGS